MSLLLGVCDSPCPELKRSPFTNKIGGFPDFFQSASLPVPPTCRVCRSNLTLLLQMYCPLEGSPYHRLFHVFCCNSPTCWSNSKSWLVLRSQELESAPVKETSDEGTGAFPAQEWCENADDWGSNDEEEVLTSVPTNQCHDLKVDIKPLQNLTASLCNLELNGYIGPHYPSLYINVFEENNGSLDLPVSPANTSASLSLDGCGLNEVRGETYESTEVKHGDKVFLKFQKHLLNCPEQIIRYKKFGAPLFTSDVNIPPTSPVCTSCGSLSSFEFQIMPQLVYVLQKTSSKLSKGLPLDTSCSSDSNPEQCSLFEVVMNSKVIEFGTVLVYTCDKSCWNNGQDYFCEEMLFVQPET